MGATLHWREPPDRDARDFETFVEFGRGRRSGRGFMAYSERSGPGVVLAHPPPSLADSVLDVARAVHAEGFTVLVPEMGLVPDHAEPERLTAAADYLIDNWHPRLGVVGFGAAAALAGQLAVERRCDAVVICGAEEADAGSLGAPVLHCAAGELLAERALEFLHYHLS
jgi:dienelactone hydrolase